MVPTMRTVWPMVAVSWLACATAGPRARANVLLDQAESCQSFVEFDARLAREREALERADGADVVPVSQALSSARRRCARAVIDALFELQERRGRSAAVAEVEALSRALGPDEMTSLIRARWRNEADLFLGDILLSGTPPPTTPRQPTPELPVDPSPERPAFPDAAFGEGAECLRRPDLLAASCLREWRRDGADAKAVDEAVKTLSERVVAASRRSPADQRLTTLGDVLRALAVPSHAEPVAALTSELMRLSEAALAEAETSWRRGALEAAAVKVRPLLGVGPTRARAERFTNDAARKHQELAQGAVGRPHAAVLHRALAKWFTGSDEPMPRLEAGRWEPVRWDCPARTPTWPPLLPGMSGSVRARCRRTTPPPAQPSDPSMRTFEFEASLPRMQFDVDATLTSFAGRQSKRLTAEEVLLEDHEAQASTRPHALDGPLQRFVTDAVTAHRTALEGEVRRGCEELPRAASTAEDRLVLLARQTGAWPLCFEHWLLATWQVAPPRFESGASAPLSGTRE
jgi:hypothetical protein